MAEQKRKQSNGAADLSGKSSRNSKNPNPKTRIYFLAAFLLFWFCAIAFRLVVLQVVRYGEFTQRASRQQQRTVEVSARRGVIYDRNGHELAMTINVDSVFAVPSEIPDQANAATLIAHVLKVEPKEVLAKIQASRSFSWIARKLDAEDSNRIRALGLKGIYFQKESKRFYPKRDLAAQVLGYVGLDDEGLGGIERSFDEQMRGKPGKMLVSVDARQRSLGRVEKQPESGQSIVLTIDEKIQYIAERELERSMAETHAEAGTVVVQNPKTGEILALASRPTFNPNAFRTSTPQALKNRAVSDIYEPGSTFKIVTLSAALEEKLTRPDEVIDCQMGSIMVFGRKVHDHKPFGNLTVSEVLQKSSDVGAIKLGLRLGDQRMDQYIRAFGFGTQTGLELPGETRGMAKPASRWTKSSIGSIAMGQEVGVSSVQLVSMASTIANDGVYTPPRIVAGSIAPRATLQTVVFKPAQQRRVVSPLTAVEMKKMLEEVVLFGTGKKAILDGYTSAGKSGTAQKIDPATGRYSATKYVASFAGFAPVALPAITISVMLDSPQGEHHGGEVGGPLFGRVAQQVLAYMNVPHDADIKNPQRLMIRASAKESDFSEGSPDRLSGEVEIADASVEPVPATGIAAKPVATKKQSDRAKLIAASFTPAKQAPVAATKIEPMPTPAIPQPTPTRGTVILDAGGGPTAPSLIGKSVRAAIETAQDAGVELDVVGTGVARAQAPAAGERVPPGTRVVVKFAR
ncbi:MAG: peptidoglycan synthetase FtsI [Candidatus Angelobacter sp.]|nr:peptidoglycan synthetase FtsI [Candidatus Angelobacter sp.]